VQIEVELVIDEILFWASLEGTQKKFSISLFQEHVVFWLARRRNTTLLGTSI
jgi:hypothetical protein